MTRLLNKLHSRYRLSRLIPVPMRSSYVQRVDGAAVRAGEIGSHFRDEDHLDLVSARWWQWRGRCLKERTIAVCIGPDDGYLSVGIGTR